MAKSKTNPESTMKVSGQTRHAMSTHIPLAQSQDRNQGQQQCARKKYSTHWWLKEGHTGKE